MAEDSNFDKKPGKKASGSGSDFKPPHKKSKDFQTYFEPKGNAPSGNQEDQAAQKGNRNDAQGSGKPKSYAKNRKESRDHPPNVWKKKHPKVSKDYILEFYAKAPLSKEIDDLVSTTENLFVNEKLVPVNQENFSLDPNEGLIPKTAFQPSTNSSSNTTASSLTNLPGPGGSATTSTNLPTTSNLPTPSNPPGTSEAPVEPSQTSTTAPSNVQATSSNVSQTTPKPWETSSSDPTQLTPIQIMREKMKRKNPLPKPDEAKRKELEGIEKKKAETEKNAPTESAQAAKPQEQVKNEESNYSNIDEMYENRLKNEKAQEKNSTENNLQEDNQIPEWDSVDANKAVQEIRKEEFLASLPQDKKTIFGDKYVEKKEDKNASQQVRNQAGGVDFSQVSFDNETKARMNDNYDLSAEELYNQQMGRGNPYSGANVHGGSQENINLSNLNYNPQDPSQNMYRVVPGQSMQQGASLYGNKNFAANQATTPTATTPKQNTPPSIIFKYFSPNYESKDWYYIDLEEKLQGPYSGRTMDEWFVKGYLPLNLHVTIGQSSQFKKLKDLADIISNHNAQSEAQPKQAVQKTPSSTSIQDQQYLQQYQNQQQQYQQQYPQQYQQQQYQSQQQYQQQQQPYYKQGSQGGVHELQRFHSDTPSYGTNFQSGSNRNDSYYAQQGASGQFGGHGSHDFVRSASATDFQSQNHYQNYGGNWQDNQQKVIQNYPNYKANQGGSGSNAYYQQDSGAYQAGFTQTGYNQAQKNPQWKGTQQASAYPSQGNFGNQGSNFAAQNPGSFSYGNVQGGQNNMMYPAQQQQNFNRSNSMGGGSVGNVNMSGYQM